MTEGQGRVQRPVVLVQMMPVGRQVDGEQPECVQEQQEQEGQPQPQPGQMTREEAERLLQAIQEDPSKVQRQRAQSLTRRRPRKDW